MRIAALVLLVACGGGGASTPTPEPPKAKVGDAGVDIANLTAKLPPFIDSVGADEPNRAFSGYVLVAQHDQVIWRGAYGMADRAKQRVPTGDTSFRIGSVTKQFTSTAILRLEQDGKLSVTDKVSKHLPAYPGPGKDVTLHQLLTHTAGIPNYTSSVANLMRKAEKVTPQQLLELFWNLPLDFEPGTKMSYSNSGYVILGAIVERAGGMPYAAYIKKHLLDPAGMTSTVVGDAETAADRAEGYQVDGGQLVPADRIDMSFPYAAGAIRSTANDLVRWHRALSGDKILDATQRAKLYKPALDNYAYGWVETPIEGRRTVWHNGGIDGFGTIYWRVPEADLVVVGWTNVSGVDVDKIGRAAVEAALGGTPKPIEKLQKGTVDPAIVARISGTFELSADEKTRLLGLKLPQQLVDSIASIAITPTNAGVSIKPNGQSEAELIPLADGSFLNQDHHIKLLFDRAGSGPIAKVQLVQGPLQITYQRK